MSTTTTPAADPAATSDAPPATKTNLSPEDQATFSAVLADLTCRHAPEGAAEEHWVGQMAMVMLRTQWADLLEQRVVEAAVTAEASKTLPSGSVLVRWRARLEKDFARAARELGASKAARRAGEVARPAPRAPLDPDEAAFEAELARDPRAAIAKLLAQPDPFAEIGTNEPERPLNRAQRRRLASRQRAA